MRPKRFFAGLDGVTLGWGELVRGDLEVHEVAVYPRGMLVEPFCRSLADAVKRCLAGRSARGMTGAELAPPSLASEGSFKGTPVE